MYLFFGVETNGLPKSYDAPVNDLLNWPRVVRIAFFRYSERGNEISSYNELVYPGDFEIPEDAEIHGITKDRALREGLSGREVFGAFIDDALKSEYLVSHNFDLNYPVVSCEISRYGLKNSIQNIKSVCTMRSQSVIDYCAFPGIFGEYKWPTLPELHEKLFGESFDESGDAGADVRACARCYFELKKRGVL